MSILIVEAFVAMRKHMLNYEALAAALKKLEDSTNHRFVEMSQILDALVHKNQKQKEQNKRKRIGYK